MKKPSWIRFGISLKGARFDKEQHGEMFRTVRDFVSLEEPEDAATELTAHEAWRQFVAREKLTGKQLASQVTRRQVFYALFAGVAVGGLFWIIDARGAIDILIGMAMISTGVLHALVHAFRVYQIRNRGLFTIQEYVGAVLNNPGNLVPRGVPENWQP